MAEKLDEDTDEQKVASTFFDMFPTDIFGPIPDELKKLIDGSGFDRLITFVTLTSADVCELEEGKTSEMKLQLGFRRLLTQMIEFAKKKLIKLQSERMIKENLTYNRTAVPSVNSVNSKKISNESNIKESLTQSIQKTIKSFCRKSV